VGFTGKSSRSYAAPDHNVRPPRLPATANSGGRFRTRGYNSLRVEIPKPNLFLIGAPRCGTTALFSYLSKHPDLFVPQVKEPHHFCRDLIEECDAFMGPNEAFPYRDIDDYIQLFATAGQAAVRGEASVNYLFSRTAPQQILEFQPAAKIIVMFRDPVAFAYSLYSKLRAMGFEDQPTFAQALALEPARRRGENLPPTVLLPSNTFYTARAAFADHLDRWRTLFPPEQLLPILLDDFHRDPVTVYRRALDFLELTPQPLPDEVIQNANTRVRSSLLQRTARACHRRGNRFSTRIANLIERANTISAPREPLAPAVEHELRDQLRPSVARLAETLNRDLLTLWHFDPE